MRILVTGREGQVARSLVARNPGFELVCTSRDELDLAQPATIERAIERIRPELIISAGAYTAVDQAESEPALAMAVNGEAPGAIGRAARRVGARVIHLSTDYVFDGALDRPWRETDPVGPLGVYGRTKLAGERNLIESGAPHAILRTAWVYSPFGKNFVKTMLRLAADREEVAVVCDQIGCPTSALDIADALFVVAKAWHEDPRRGLNQVFHFSGTGETSWAGLAEATFALSAREGGASARVRPIPTSEYPTPAQRPVNSRLDCTRFATVFGNRAPPWQDSLATVVTDLVSYTRCS